MALLALIALQHWGIGRLSFRRDGIRMTATAVERSTYVLTGSATLFAVMSYWQPLGGILWNCGDEVLRVVLLSSYFFGWIVLLLSAFLTGYLDNSGLKKAGANSGRREAYLFDSVRYPVYAAWLLILWSTPVMSYSRLAIASAAAVYVATSVAKRSSSALPRLQVRMPSLRSRPKVQAAVQRWNPASLVLSNSSWEQRVPKA
jgi:hypothetical protein